MSDTKEIGEVQAILHQIRERKDLKFKANPYLRSTYTDFDGKEHPLDLRYYQIQGILHLSIMPRFLLGDDTGLGKCTSPETLVFSDSGHLKIGDLLPNYRDLPEGFHPAPDNAPRIWTGTKYAPLKSVYNGGIKPRVKIQTESGHEIVCSWTHPLRVIVDTVNMDANITEEAWVPAIQIQEMDLVCLEVDGKKVWSPACPSLIMEPDHVLDLEIDDPDHSFVGNGFLCHNTIQTIGALTGIWTQDPSHKAVVLTTKSAVGQWVDEVEKFTTGVTAYICRGTPVARKKAVKQWLDDPGPAVLVIGYGSFRKDAKELIPHFNGITLIADEASAFKNDQSQIHQWIKYATTHVARFWALTATMIENHLMEGWALYSVIQPGLFGSRSHFMDTYCITQLQQIGARKIKTIVGYRPDGPSNFRKIVDPYFLGRPKHLVAKELPPLIRQRILVELTERQQREYQDALAGLITVTRDGESQDVETTKLTALAYCQQIVNHPATLQLDGDVSDAALDALQDGESEKLEALIEMLTEGALQDSRVIVFSRFRVMIDIIMHRLRREKIPATRITGSENEDQRTKNKADFQAGRARVICITTAARQGVNLQAASDLVFYDTPWSAGDFLQIVGRMIRIGSVHATVNAYHLAARNTVDERVLQVLSKKMVLLESVLGKRLKENGDTDGDDETGTAVPAEFQTKSDVKELYDLLRQDARSASFVDAKAPKP